MRDSGAVQGTKTVVKGTAGWLGNTIKGGAGLLGSVMGPAVGGFGGLLSGALPIVGVISGIIAVVSLLTDKLGGVDAIVQKVFGEDGLAAFSKFREAFEELFSEGGVAKALSGLRDQFSGVLEGGRFLSTLFGGQENGLAAFDGLVQVIQSVMDIVGQVVRFANTTVKPIIQEIFNFITTTVIPKIVQIFTAAAPTISNIISNLGTAIMTVAGIIGTAIQTVLPIVENIISVILSIASVVVPAVLEGIEALSAQLVPIVEGIQRVFSGVIDFIAGVFTGDWDRVWSGVVDIFGGIFDALAGLVKAPLNAAITLINKAIGAINGIGFTLPDWDWLGDLAGKEFNLNIPEIPMLAKGGFTSGPSIAGEAGTEAVISFQRSERAKNIATWLKAGRMLGVARELKDLPAGGGSGNSPSFVFAPNVQISGNASRAEVDAALAESEQRWEAWLEQNFERLIARAERERGRRAYA